MNMITKIFEGKRIALEKELELKETVEELKNKGIKPKLVSVLVGENKVSELYLSLKKKAAFRVGVGLDVKNLSSSTSLDEILEKIKKINKDSDVHGIMIQLPLPHNLRLKTKDLIDSIDPKKDVDGMQDESQFLTPVTKAVLIAIKEASEFIHTPPKVVVVGYTGFEGSKIYKTLKEMDYEVEGVGRKTSLLENLTRRADILISATGVTGLITEDIVKKGAVVIDVGSPHGDVREDGVVKKVSFLTPVPGGIGPVTISSLLENIVEAASLNLKKN